GSHFEIVHGESLVLPAVAVQPDGRERALRVGRVAQKEVGVGMALSSDSVVGEIARKSHVAEQRGGSEIVVPFQTVDFKSDLHAVAALEPAQMILELLAVVAEAGIRKISLRDGLQSD